MKTIPFIIGLIVGASLYLGVQGFVTSVQLKQEINQLYAQNGFLQKQIDEMSHKFDVSMALLEQIENDRKKEW